MTESWRKWPTSAEYELAQQIREARGAFADKVETWAETYRGRRTIADQMRVEALELIAGRVAEMQAEYDTRLALLGTSLDEPLTRLVAERDALRDHVEKLQQQVVEKRTIREERRAAEDGMVEVEFSNGYKSWTVADLEDIAYRLRIGGAVDDSTVEVEKYRIKGLVISPEVVHLERAARTPAPAPAPAPVVEVRGFSGPQVWAIAGGASALVSLIGLILRVIL